MAADKILIGIDQSEGIYVLTGDGIRQSKKYINYEDLEEIFKQNIKIDTGILPRNCIYYARQDRGYLAVLQVDPQQLDILYHGRRSSEVLKYKVPIPYVYFAYLVRDRRVVDSYCISSKYPVLEKTTQMYTFPYGNVFDDFRICWGRQVLPEIPNPRYLADLPDLFFAAPFNGDLSENRFVGFNYENNNLGHFFSDLNGRAMFPHNKLIENCTFEDFLNKVRRSL